MLKAHIKRHRLAHSINDIWRHDNRLISEIQLFQARKTLKPVKYSSLSLWKTTLHYSKRCCYFKSANSVYYLCFYSTSIDWSWTRATTQTHWPQDIPVRDGKGNISRSAKRNRKSVHILSVLVWYSISPYVPFLWMPYNINTWRRGAHEVMSTRSKNKQLTLPHIVLHG